MRCLILLLAVATLVSAAERPRKKLLEYGWDVPYPDYVRDHLREMEQQPFDGLVFRVRDLNHMFDPRPWDPAVMQVQIEQLQAIRWERFTDNFLTLYAANQHGMDWFDDAQWEQIAANLALHQRAARAAGCVGVCVDYEPYGPNPWTFTAGAHSFAETQAQVRARGAQFQRALQAGWPDLKVLTLFQLSFHASLVDIASPEELLRQLEAHSYGLLPAFVNGMLAAADPGVRLIDGNEMAYYFTSSEEFYRWYQAIRQRLMTLIEPDLREKYQAQVRAGMALYVDQILGLRQGTPVLSNHLPRDRQLDWWQHNVWHALNSTDEYVWLYSERAAWWPANLPDGLRERTAAARAQQAAGQPVGIDLEPIIAEARRNEQAALAARLIDRRAVVARAAAPPTVDGRLDDACWRIAAFEPFLRSAAVESPEPTAGTVARVCWDDRALYVGLVCDEPNPAGLVSVGRNHDDPVWQGDVVELFCSLGAEPLPYLHVIVSPAGVRWDGRNGGPGDDVAYNAEWRAVCRVEPPGWTAEIAVPWSELGGPPTGPRRANLCRQRQQTGELSSWNPIVRGFIEPERLGVWEFAR